MHRRQPTIAFNRILSLAAVLLAVSVLNPATISAAAIAGVPDRINPALQATNTQSRRTPTATELPVFPVITATANPDGSVSHKVEPGQTLIGIAEAYGLQVNDLQAMNQLQPDAVIYPGDTLLIVAGAAPSVTPTITETARPTSPPTATRRPPTASPTQTQVQTVTPTATATPWLRMPAVDTRSMGLVLIVVCAIGLVAVGITGFRSRSR